MWRIIYHSRKLFVSVLFGLLILPSTILAAERAIYATGFEDNNGQYEVGVVTSDVLWEWGSPDTTAKPSGPAACNSGQKCWGTSMSQNITGTGTLTSPVIEVPTLSTGQVARISFYAYIDVPVMASSSGNADIYVSSDNKQTWTKLARLLEKMAGGWQRYDFDISEFAGKTINLQFNAFVIDSAPSPGLYIDDVAVTIVDLPSPSKIMTLQGWEDPASYASCPWIFTWDGTNFVQDNDIYSVARYEQNKMRDFYLLQKPLVAKQGSYKLEVREIETENSWTDMVGLLTLDHAVDVAIAPDNNGNIFAYKPTDLIAPVVASSNTGSNVLAQIINKDSNGFNAYSDDYIDVDFGAVDISGGARLVLRIKGFLLGAGVNKPFTGPPAIVVQMKDAGGVWQEIGRLNPRFDWSVGAFDLAPHIMTPVGSLKVRLVSISHATKYHEIDFVALSLGAQPTFSRVELPMESATYGGADVKAKLEATDNQYVSMGTGNKISLSFAAQPVPQGQIREFVLVSEGYYVPNGDTYFVYTWDGSKWAQRDAVSFTTPIGTDSTKLFNLSSYLPDPNGEYKVRIWQDYRYESAAINFVGMTVDTLTGTLDKATNICDDSSILSSVGVADSSWFDFSGCSGRTRWAEFSWTGLPIHIPPSVPADKLKSRGGNIRWDYYSPTGDPQVGFDVQVWSGPGATGSILWSPPTFTSTAQVVRYAGSPLVPGQTYYLRMRLFDGKAWGGWVETAFAAPIRDGILVPANGKTLPDLSDALKALQIELGIISASDDDLDGGDIAPLGLDGKPLGDGKIDVYDVIGILRKIIGL